MSRTHGKVKLEEKWCGHALIVMAEGSRPPVSPETVVAAVVAQCGVNLHNVKVQVCGPPFDFFARFRSSEDITCASVQRRDPRDEHLASRVRMAGVRAVIPMNLRFQRFPRVVWEP